jgi:DNA-binding PadR family transcriptional regulator
MSLRHALLGLLANRTASGYHLLKLFERSLANVWPASQSQVYGELTRLADAGLLEVAARGPRGRKDYTITETGHAELLHWLTETPPALSHRNDALLRMFFLNLLTPDQSLALLHRHASQAAGHHAELRRLRDGDDWHESGKLTANGRLVLEYGLRLTAMQEHWARWAAATIATEAASIAPPAAPA